MNGFIISSDVLAKALKRLAIAVPSKPVLPLLANVLIKSFDGKVHLTTTNLELAIVASCDAETTGDNTALMVPFAYLADIASAIKHQPLSFRVAKKKVVICSDDAEYEQELEDVEAYPATKFVSSKNPDFELGESYLHAMQLARASALTGDDLRTHLSTVCFDFAGSAIVSTDANILFRKQIDISSHGDTKDQLLITLGTLKAISGITSAKMSWNSKFIQFAAAGLTVVQRQLESAYPNYNSAIPQRNPNLRIERAMLIDRLEKAAVVGSEISKVDIEPSETALQMTVLNPEKGRVGKLAMPVMSNTSTVKHFALNSKKLLTILGQTDADEIVLHVTAPNKAVLVTAPQDSDFLALIMPIMTA